MSARNATGTQRKRSTLATMRREMDNIMRRLHQAGTLSPVELASLGDEVFTLLNRQRVALGLDPVPDPAEEEDEG